MLLPPSLVCHDQSLGEVENSIGPTFTICFFSFKTLVMISLGILLNVGDYTKSNRTMKAAYIFLFIFSIEIAWMIYEVREWITTQSAETTAEQC